MIHLVARYHGANKLCVFLHIEVFPGCKLVFFMAFQLTGWLSLDQIISENASIVRCWQPFPPPSGKIIACTPLRIQRSLRYISRAAQSPGFASGTDGCCAGGRRTLSHTSWGFCEQPCSRVHTHHLVQQPQRHNSDRASDVGLA